MIKLLKNKLNSCVNNDDILWKSNNIELYNKYSQNISPNKKQDIKLEKEVIKLENKDIKLEKQDIKLENKDIKLEKQDIKLEKQDIILEMFNENKDIQLEKVNKNKLEKSIIKKKISLKVLENKKIIFKPIDIILSETGTFDNCTSTVKEKLIDFISKIEFSKVFGMKKTSEIMSGIVNNKWNVSTALFISFLFNKQVNYNNSNIIYNKENIKGTINTSC